MESAIGPAHVVQPCSLKRMTLTAQHPYINKLLTYGRTGSEISFGMQNKYLYLKVRVFIYFSSNLKHNAMGCKRYREVYSVNRKLIEYQDPQKSWSIDKISLEKWKK